MARTLLLWSFVLMGLIACNEENLTKDELVDGSRLTDSTAYRLKRILNYAKSTDKTPYGFQETVYNNDGTVKRVSNYDYPNRLTTYQTFDYANGKLSKKSIYDGRVNALSLGTYVLYDYQNDRLGKEELFLADGTSRYATHYRYESGKLAETYKTNQELGVHHRYTYRYDNRGRLVREESFMYKGELSDYTLYRYDSLSRLIEKDTFDPAQQLTVATRFTYAGTDTLLREVVTENKTVNAKQTLAYIYDGQRNVIELRQNGRTLEKRQYANKLLTERIVYAPNFDYQEWTVTRYAYERR